MADPATGTVITTFFTSGSGSPATGLSPTLIIRNVTTTSIVLTGSMSEVGDGWYKFPFPSYTGSVDYAVRCDGGSGSLDSQFTFAGNENFVEDIWGAQREDNKLAGSFGQALRDIYDIEVGSWRITTAGDMELLRSGSNEVIARFDLRKLDGSDLTDPANEDPFRRDRI